MITIKDKHRNLLSANWLGIINLIARCGHGELVVLLLDKITNNSLRPYGDIKIWDIDF